MEAIRWRALLLTALAPAAWGTTYLVTERLLPPDRPLLSATLRALPTGLVLLAVTRRLPSREWWWRALLLGLCNIGMFFPLLFLITEVTSVGSALSRLASSNPSIPGISMSETTPAKRGSARNASRAWPPLDAVTTV